MSIINMDAAKASAEKGTGAGLSTGNWMVGLGVGLADYAANYGSTIGAAAYTGGLSKKAQMRAFQHQYDMYMLDYNLHTPSQQMKLLKEAKLNPNLVYGGSNPANVSASAPSAPTGSVPNVTPPKSQLLSEYLDFRLREAQIKNMEAQTAKTVAESQFLDLTFGVRNDILRGRATSLESGTSQRQAELDYLAKHGYYPGHGPSGKLNQILNGIENLPQSTQNIINEAASTYQGIKDWLNDPKSASQRDSEHLQLLIEQNDLIQALKDPTWNKSQRSYLEDRLRDVNSTLKLKGRR